MQPFSFAIFSTPSVTHPNIPRLALFKEFVVGNVT